MFTPEFRLVADLCNPELTTAPRYPIQKSGVDWERFLRLATFHRVEGLVFHALPRLEAEIPDEIRSSLSDAARRIAAQSLESTLASHELLGRFEGAGVALLFLKGVTLGALAYGNPSLKSAVDIDVLVDGADLSRAAGLLRQCGYCLSSPGESPGDRLLRAWHRDWKESVWTKKSAALWLDLHSRAADNARLIPGIDVHSPHQLVEVASGFRLPTFADDELFAYLAVHGASSAWFRLKWIADFAWLLHGRTSAAVDRLYRRSKEFGAGRAAGQALLVADALFGTLEPNRPLREAIRSDGGTRRLARAALGQLTSDRGEPTERCLGTLRIHQTQFALAAGLPYKVTEFASQVRRLAWRFS